MNLAGEKTNTEQMEYAVSEFSAVMDWHISEIPVKLFVILVKRISPDHDHITDLLPDLFKHISL